MSIRRQSCEGCFRERRKCDLTRPACSRCQYRNRPCRYKYPPQRKDRQLMRNVDDSTLTEATLTSTAFQISRNETQWLESAQNSSIARYLGHLGEIPIMMTSLKDRATYRLKRYPLMFAKYAATDFIHKDLHGGMLPEPLLAAFGICAGCAVLNEANRLPLFQALEAEMAKLWPLAYSMEDAQLLDGLVLLQVTVLYQTIRLFYGSIEQAMMAERQEYHIRAFALRLLQRASANIWVEPRTWKTWLMEESIRRTVLVVFKLHTLYHFAIYGKCTELAALSLLPVSQRLRLWDLGETEFRSVDMLSTITYRDYARRNQDARFYAYDQLTPFEKLIFVGCNMSSAVEASS